MRRINDWAVQGTWPELVLLMEIPLAEQERRLSKRTLDRFEQEDGGFHQRVRDGFRALADAEPDRWVVIDATMSRDDVAAAVRAAVRDRLGI